MKKKKKFMVALVTFESEVLFTHFHDRDPNRWEFCDSASKHLQSSITVIWSDCSTNRLQMVKVSCVTPDSLAVFILYSTSICNRSLYSIMQSTFLSLCFQQSGMLRSTLNVVKCPEVQDVHEHVVCFDNYNTSGPSLYPMQPIFRIEL